VPFASKYLISSSKSFKSEVILSCSAQRADYDRLPCISSGGAVGVRTGTWNRARNGPADKRCCVLARKQTVIDFGQLIELGEHQHNRQ
jgi:hypothetical protein